MLHHPLDLLLVLQGVRLRRLVVGRARLAHNAIGNVSAQLILDPGPLHAVGRQHKQPVYLPLLVQVAGLVDGRLGLAGARHPTQEARDVVAVLLELLQLVGERLGLELVAVFQDSFLFY